MNMFKIGEVAQRDAFANALIELSGHNDKIVALDSDLSNSSGFAKYAKAFPERFINCGIQEANMFGVAAGLSREGFIPVAHTFAAFASRRALDQLYVSALYNKQHVKILASDAGICNGANGGTHLAYEDLGTMLTLPELKVIDFTDPIMIKKLLPQIMEDPTNYYLRIHRKNTKFVYSDEQEFTIGKAVRLREGDDLAIICNSSIAVEQGLLAAETLSKKGIEAEVVDMFTLSPLDVEYINDCAIRHKVLVTIENSSVVNGLAYAIAYCLSQGTNHPKLFNFGIQKHLGEVGTLDYLMKVNGFSAGQIVEKLLLSCF